MQKGRGLNTKLSLTLSGEEWNGQEHVIYNVSVGELMSEGWKSFRENFVEFLALNKLEKGAVFIYLRLCVIARPFVWIIYTPLRASP